MQMSPLIAVHLSAALGAVAIGPVALWSRLGHAQRTRLHRAFGYAWVTLMLVTATSALFIRDDGPPNIAGYTPIHLLVPVTYVSIFLGLRFMLRGNLIAHRYTMIFTYVGACLVAGAFTLLPGRYLGQLVWGRWLGWL